MTDTPEPPDAVKHIREIITNGWGTDKEMLAINPWDIGNYIDALTAKVAEKDKQISELYAAIGRLEHEIELYDAAPGDAAFAVQMQLQAEHHIVENHKLRADRDALTAKLMAAEQVIRSYADDRKYRTFPMPLGNGQTVEVRGLGHASSYEARAYKAAADKGIVKTDAWIEWHGGECPVRPMIHVEMKIRAEEVGIVFGPAGQKTVNWQHNGGGWDVIAYRITNTEDEQ